MNIKKINTCIYIRMINVNEKNSINDEPKIRPVLH